MGHVQDSAPIPAQMDVKMGVKAVRVVVRVPVPANARIIVQRDVLTVVARTVKIRVYLVAVSDVVIHAIRDVQMYAHRVL